MALYLNKFDGARIQIHKKLDKVKIYSRNLADVTESLPDICSIIRSELKADEAVVEGEAVAVDNDGRPLPFQDLMRRFRRIHNVSELTKHIPLRLYLFDIL